VTPALKAILSAVGGIALLNEIRGLFVVATLILSGGASDLVSAVAGIITRGLM